jgi:threonyl-tRNA synthetase
MENSSVAVRTCGGEDLGSMTLEELTTKLNAEVASHR